MPVLIAPPFPWFGGKSRIVDIVWLRFGDVPNYVEPFAGSLAVLLNRPHAPKVETVNDLECYLANFWRALQGAPEEVARWADWPVNEADLHARHDWLLARAEFRQRMHHDADYYDAKVAGWWVWGICQWIGSGWCDSACYRDDNPQAPWQKRPHLGNPGRGVHRPSQQLPHLGNPGMGVHRPSQKLPHLGDPGMGVDLYAYLAALSERLRGVRVCCGDWSRVLGPSPTTKNGTTAVLLDPPYADDDRATLYSQESFTVAHDVRDWAIANGDNPDLRIALCGYDPLTMPDGWERVRWKACGGYGSQGEENGRANAHREVVWFSPHCLKPSGARQLELLP